MIKVKIASIIPKTAINWTNCGLGHFKATSPARLKRKINVYQKNRFELPFCSTNNCSQNT